MITKPNEISFQELLLNCHYVEGSSSCKNNYFIVLLLDLTVLYHIDFRTVDVLNINYL